MAGTMKLRRPVFRREGSGHRTPPASREAATPVARALGLSLLAIPACLRPASAQTAGPTAAPTAATPTTTVVVPGHGGYAASAQFHTGDADLGPLGTQQILTTPLSVTTIPEDLLVDDQSRTINDSLRYLPSVEVRDQQGLEVSRPQSRGFESTITENTRLDGLNIIGTTAIPTENLEDIQVLNGLAGALYGPEAPAGVFDYVLKRPTDTPIERFVESYDSNSVLTEEVDAGGRTGRNGWFGYRLDVVHGEGESFVTGSYLDRTLASGDFDIHLDDRTVIQLDASHYEEDATGLPGSIVYDTASTNPKTNSSTLLPSAVDPTRVGYGQPGAGTDLITDTGLAKIIHHFDDDWTLEIGGLYQNAIRNLFGITNTLQNNEGDYVTTKNFTAVPHFTDGSNEAYLNGHVTILGARNDVTLGTNGFINDQYSYRNSITTTLGSASLQDPVVFGYKPIPYNGGQYFSAYEDQQSLIEGDTVHLDRQFAVQTVFSESFLSSKSYNSKDVVTASQSHDGLFSPTVSLIYTPTSRWTAYATYAESWEEGDQAPSTASNANAFLAPYHDTEVEIGAKYAPMKQLLLTLDGFRITRPFADANAANLYEVIGTQRNYGIEFFAQGDVDPSLSVIGGVTYIDARLQNTGVADTDGGLVVGVPEWKSDVALDYHPAFMRGVALTGAAHYESERAATNVKNQSFAAPYATLDVGARYSTRIERRYVTVRVGAINVTDTRYYASVADGTIVGSPGANTAYLGTPRTVLASLEVDL